MGKPLTATEICENILKEHWSNCAERSLPQTCTKLQERMLERRNELAIAYEDLIEQTGGCATAVYLFFDSLMCAVFAWNPTSISSMRHDKARLTEVNVSISETADRLGALLAEREEIQNRNSFGTGTLYHIVNVVSEASSQNYLFKNRVEEDLKALSARYDMKYWPSLSDIVDVIGLDAENTQISIHDEVTEAALASPRTSKADFCRAFFQRVKDEACDTPSALRSDFNLKDESWASVINCALDLPPEELIDGQYIKRLRQRSREKAQTQV